MNRFISFLFFLAISLNFLPAHGAERYQICTGQFGGTSYQFVFAITEVMKKIAPHFEIIPMETQGAPSSIAKSSTDPGKILTNLNTIEFMKARQGKSPYPRPLTNLRLIGFVSQSVQTLITFDPAIRTVADIKGKRVGLGAKNGVLGTPLWNLIKQEMGDTGKTNVTYSNWSTIQSSLMDGIFDVTALGVTSSSTRKWTPVSIYNEIVASRGEPYFIPFKEETINAVAKNMDEPIIPLLMPKGCISDNVPSADTLAWQVLLGVGAYTEMSDDVAYYIAKVLYEEQEEMAKYTPIGLDMSPNLVVPDKKFFDDSLIHPGALKYYKEIGAR